METQIVTAAVECVPTIAYLGTAATCFIIGVLLGYKIGRDGQES